MSETECKYTCINCGLKVKELYKVYSPTVLKLSTCGSCNLVVDKYIEYDLIIIVIDLILLNPEAYRHVLFNTDYTFHWKLLIILELMEAYWELSWNQTLAASLNNKPHLLDKFFTGDLEYYKTLLHVLCRNIIFFLIILACTFLRELWYTFNDNKPIKNAFKFTSFNTLVNQVLKCIILSSIGLFLFLPSLIWERHGTEEYHFVFVIVYTALSQLVAYTVFSRSSKLWSIVVILTAYIAKINTSYWLTYSINPIHHK